MDAVRRSGSRRSGGWRRVLTAWLCVAAGAGAGVASADAAPAICPPLVQQRAAPDGVRAAPAIDRGLLWEVRRGSHVSHLYGTLHVGKPQWVQPGPALHRALDASDVLALEIDPDDPQLAAALSAAGPSLFVPNASPDARQALQLRLQQAMDRACVPHAALAALHPLLQAVTLTVLEARWLGMDAQYAQERMLSTWAADHGLPLVSLESAAQQVALLLPDDAEAARMSLQQLLTQLENGSGRRVLQRLAGAWEHGDLAMLADFERWCECAATETERDFMRKLNDDRNGPMADRIAALHNTGKRVLVAVGALHMTGPRSLPKLLAQRGFEVRRIRFER